METRWEESVHERGIEIEIEIEIEQVSMENFPSWVNIRGGRYGRPVLKRDGCLQSLPICLSELPASPALRKLSENSQRDVDSQ